MGSVTPPCKCDFCLIYGAPAEEEEPATLDTMALGALKFALAGVALMASFFV